MAFFTTRTDADGRILTAGTIEHVKEIASTVTGGGSGPDILIRVTANTTPGIRLEECACS